MIQINEEYFIGGEEKNIILYKAKLGKEGKSKGQIRHEEVCYPKNIPLLLKSPVNRKIKIALGEAQSFEELNKRIDNIEEMIDTFCEKYEKSMLKELGEK